MLLSAANQASPCATVWSRAASNGSNLTNSSDICVGVPPQEYDFVAFTEYELDPTQIVGHLCMARKLNRSKRVSVAQKYHTKLMTESQRNEFEAADTLLMTHVEY